MPRPMTRPDKATKESFSLYEEDRQRLHAFMKRHGITNSSEGVRRIFVVGDDEARSEELRALQADLVSAQEKHVAAKARAERLEQENEAISKELQAYRASPLVHVVREVQEVLLVCARSKSTLKSLHEECKRGGAAEDAGQRFVGETRLLVRARAALMDAGEEKPWHVIGEAIVGLHQVTRQATLEI